MLALDDADDAMADEVRDAMDPLWHALSEDERAFLNSRELVRVRGFQVDVGDLLLEPVEALPMQEHEKLEDIDGWQIPVVGVAA